MDMFELPFGKFMEWLERHNMLPNKPAPVLHYSENKEMFILYFKGTEWRYFTIITKAEIIEFGIAGGSTKENSIREFEINILTHAVRISYALFEKSYLNENSPKSLQSEKIKDAEIEIIDVIDKPLEREEPNESKKEDQRKEVTKDTPDEDIIEESKSYDDFIVMNFKKWEEQALNAVDKIDIEKSFQIFEKTFGEFLQALFNGITSLAFQRGSRKFITESMKEGLKEAEQDTNVDIGISETFSNRVHALAEQELNGYTIQGKKWHGMKGVTHELRNDILNSIRDGVIEKESRKQLKERVKDLFKTAKDSQAERIARTETTRFVNEGKLQGFKDSGVEGRKTWLIVDDNDTSPVCKRLGKTYGEKGIPFDEPFRDEKTGKEYMIPPALPHCRSIIGFELPEKEE